MGMMQAKLLFIVAGGLGASFIIPNGSWWAATLYINVYYSGWFGTNLLRYNTRLVTQEYIYIYDEHSIYIWMCRKCAIQTTRFNFVNLLWIGAFTTQGIIGVYKYTWVEWQGSFRFQFALRNQLSCSINM